MNWHLPLDPTICAKLCLTLLHSVWQTGLIALAVWGVDAFWRGLSLERRYALHVVALLVAVTAMPITFLLLSVSELQSITATPIAATAEPSTTAAVPGTASAALPTGFRAERTIVESPSTSPQSPADDTVVDGAMPRVAFLDAIGGWQAMAPWLSAIYLLGVAAMLCRLIAATVGAHRIVSRADPITEGPMVDALRGLARQWSMKSVPALARAGQIVTPKVVGLVRPTILLPVAAASGLTPAELEMILAHELAHVRRYDLWVNLLQRLAEAVLFYHPAIWLLSRRISVLREYCCDELSCQAPSRPATVSRVHYAMALVHVVELAHPGCEGHEDLAALAASGGSPSELRRRVARLFGEPVREPLHLTRGGLAMLLVLGAALVFGPTAWPSRADAPAEAAEKKQVTDEPAASTESPQPPREFHLTVLGPDGKPVPQAQVEIRTRPALTAEQITRGKFKLQARYGTMATTDDEGRLSVSLPNDPELFAIRINKPGYGPYWAEWQSFAHPQSRPFAFTAALDAGWSVGGVVVDEAGEPVKGVSISPSIQFKKRPGDNDELGVGTRITTAADGSWRYDMVPDSKTEVHLSLNHPDYAPLRLSVPRDGFGIGLDEEPTGRLVLKRGLTVTGTVTDDAGQPIAGALVKTKFSNDIRETKTDDTGKYRLSGCESRSARIVVSAPGRATDMKELHVTADMEPVDFTMQPGGKIRVRVVDAEGKGIPKARIFFQRWRGPFDYFEFSHVSQYANEQGVWEWNEAPLDEFEADICPPDGMQLSRQKLVARRDEYVFAPPPALVVSGRVVDAETKQPIKTFRVVPGLRNQDPRIRMNWIPRDAYEASEGTYRIRFSDSYLAHLVRIEAAGYQVAISRDIRSDEGAVNVDFELQPARDIAATIVTLDGEPASAADIALGVAGSQISIRNGQFDGQTYATRLTADKDGRFSIPARNEPFQLVILHAEGFAHVKGGDAAIPERIVLTPWARVEGTFQIGRQPAANIPLGLNASGIHSYGEDVPRIFSHYYATTGQQGAYAFERVFPGKGHIGRNITWMVEDGATEVTSSVMAFVELPAGETARIKLGGKGRVVVGKLQPPPAASKVDWRFVRIRLSVALTPPVLPELPPGAKDDPVRQQAWREAYQVFQDLEYQQPWITASVDRDGRFRIDDVPPDDYVLSVSGDHRQAAVLRDHRISVPASEPGQAEKPVDLGALQLQ